MGASGFLHGFISPIEINLLLPLCSSFINHRDHTVNGFHGTESYNIQSSNGGDTVSLGLSTFSWVFFQGGVGVTLEGNVGWSVGKI